VLDSSTIAAPGAGAVLAHHTPVRTRVVVPGDMHRSPPVTLRGIRLRWRWLAPAALALFAVLALAAAIHGGAALVWDAPITNSSVALRSPAIDQSARWASRLGSTPVVLTAGVAGVALAARRCRSVALVMLVTVAARPPVEWLLKELIERPRPSGARLVAGTGFSYPSGHVLAAAATWGFVPVIAGLYVRRRNVWWMLTGLAWAVIAVVAWSRVWLGVHWTSDVVGSLALAFVALSMAERAIDRIDRRHRSPGRKELPVGLMPTSPAGTAGRNRRERQAGQAALPEARDQGREGLGRLGRYVEVDDASG
jgi:undecaprenyl-diphosphatase